VRDVLVWTKAPLLFRPELVPPDGLEEQRPAGTDEVKRLGDRPIVIRVRMGKASTEVAANGDDAELLLGPYSSAGPKPPGMGEVSETLAEPG
jgi:hypothetical protein